MANPKVCFLIKVSNYNSDKTPSVTELSVPGEIVPFMIPRKIYQLETLAKGSNTYKLRASFLESLNPGPEFRLEIEAMLFTIMSNKSVSIGNAFIPNIQKVSRCTNEFI